jgi:uncharacterized protein YndB with AHSA1/START domain
VKTSASRELLAPVGDVWQFLAEPYHLADWWPGVSGVQPDRRGVAAGARWRVLGGGRGGILRRPQAEQTLLVRAVETRRLLAWHLTGERLDAVVELEPLAADRTRVTVSIEAPVIAGARRTLARQAVSRLYDLCQTAASL